MGQVESLARPGGNVTGFTPFLPSLSSKWIELLKEVSPQLARVSIVFNPNTAPNAELFVRSAEAVASSLGLTVSPATVRNDADIERTIKELAIVPGGGLILVPDPFTNARYQIIATTAVRERVPLIAAFRVFTTTGGLLSYGVNVNEEYRRAASYVDRILKGEKPAYLPVQAPTKFELVINLKTAKALGLTVPQTLLVAADEVIE